MRKPFTTAMRTWLGREIQKGMRRLSIGNLAALEREARRYPAVEEGGHWERGGYETMAEPLVARVICVNALDAIAREVEPSEHIDDWFAELQENLPKAARRPLTATERQPVLDRAKRYQAECEAEREQIADDAEMRRAAAERLGELRRQIEAGAA